MSSMGILAQTARDNGWTTEDCGSCLTLTRGQEQIVVTCGTTGRIAGVTVRQPKGSYSIMTGPGKRGRVMEILDAKPEVAACPEEQPRTLEQIADSVWALAGPHFEHMSAAQARMAERLVREAYLSGQATQALPLVRYYFNAGTGKPEIEVLDEAGRVVFTGQLADTSPPWVGWHRVIPNGPVDLPPKYKIRKKS